MVPFRGGRGHRGLLGASCILLLDPGVGYVGEFPWQKFVDMHTCDSCIFICR